MLRRGLTSEAQEPERIQGERAARPWLDSNGPITEAQPPHGLLLQEPNLSPEACSTAVMSLILFEADSGSGGGGKNSD
jgi:hypothetical protein